MSEKNSGFGFNRGSRLVMEMTGRNATTEEIVQALTTLLGLKLIDQEALSNLRDSLQASKSEEAAEVQLLPTFLGGDPIQSQEKNTLQSMIDYAILLAELAWGIIETYLSGNSGVDRKALADKEVTFFKLLEDVVSLTEEEIAELTEIFKNNPGRILSKDGITSVRRALGSIIIERSATGQGFGGVSLREKLGLTPSVNTQIADKSLETAKFLAEKFFGESFVNLMLALAKIYSAVGNGYKPIPTVSFMRSLRNLAKANPELAQEVMVVSENLAGFDPIEKDKLILLKKTDDQLDISQHLLNRQSLKDDSPVDSLQTNYFEELHLLAITASAQELPSQRHLEELLLAVELCSDNEPLLVGDAPNPQVLVLVAEATRLNRKVDHFMERAGFRAQRIKNDQGQWETVYPEVPQPKGYTSPIPWRGGAVKNDAQKARRYENDAASLITITSANQAAS
jgi:hypothetical protein